MPLTDEDTPLNDLLKAAGVTHEADAYTKTDQCHVLRAPDGSIIGRFDAFSAWKNIEFIRDVAAQRPACAPSA